MQRPRGRAARVRADVHRAVVDLLQELPVDGLTIPLIAQRSGVHQTTIYRRWGTAAGVIEDVVAAGPARTVPLPDTGSLRGDLEAYATAVADTLSGPLRVVILRTAITNPDAAKVFTERRAQLRTMLQRAHRRGEDAPPVDDLLDHVVGPLYLRALFGLPLTGPQARRLVTRLLTRTPKT